MVQRTWGGLGSANARGRARRQPSALACVAGKLCRALELAPRLFVAVDLLEQVGARARQEMVVRERGVAAQLVEEREA